MERKTNIEILRVIAMSMIIIHHICMHCIYPQLADVNSFWQYNNGFYREPLFYQRLMLLEVPASMGKTANAIFVLISGYFLVERGRNDGVFKNIFEIVYQAIFASFFLTIVSFLYFKLNSSNYISLFPVTLFNEEWWFIGYYIFIVICGWLVLNNFLWGLKREKYRFFVLVLFCCCSFSWIGTAFDGLFGYGRIAVCGIFLYCLGGYIKKYGTMTNVRTPILLLIIVALYGMLFLSNYNSNYNSIQDYKIAGTEQQYIPRLTYYQDYSFIPILIGIILFVIFLRINISAHRYFNFYSKSLFMTYLIHDNQFVHRVWREYDWVTLLHNNILLFYLYNILWTIGILGGGFIVYLLYRLCKRLIKNMY